MTGSPGEIEKKNVGGKTILPIMGMSTDVFDPNDTRNQRYGAYYGRGRQESMKCRGKPFESRSKEILWSPIMP